MTTPNETNMHEGVRDRQCAYDLEYEKALHALLYSDEALDPEDDPLQQRLRDDDGQVVPGCYITKPTPVY